MVQITGQRRPDRGTIGRSGARRDYRMSTHGANSKRENARGAAAMSGKADALLASPEGRR